MTIIKKFEPEEIKSKFPKKYGVLVVLLLLILTVIEIWVSNTVITYGDKFESLSKLSKSIQMENLILENQIASSNSLLSIASKSAALGFSKTESIQYIR